MVLSCAISLLTHKGGIPYTPPHWKQVLITSPHPNERHVAEDRRDCYWL
jgi:hypothetical protein